MEPIPFPVGGSMERIQWQMAGGHRVLFVDYTGVRPDEWVALIEAEHRVIVAEPERSVLLLSDFTGAKFNPDVSRTLDGLGQLHSDRIRASAVVGPTAVMRLAMANTGRTAGRRLQPVDTREEGLRYLADIADEAARRAS
jgi:hypothetical protein